MSTLPQCICGSRLYQLDDHHITCDSAECPLCWKHVDVGWRVEGRSHGNLSYTSDTFWSTEQGSIFDASLRCADCLASLRKRQRQGLVNRNLRLAMIRQYRYWQDGQWQVIS